MTFRKGMRKAKVLAHADIALYVKRVVHIWLTSKVPAISHAWEEFETQTEWECHLSFTQMCCIFDMLRIIREHISEEEQYTAHLATPIIASWREGIFYVSGNVCINKIADIQNRRNALAIQYVVIHIYSLSLTATVIRLDFRLDLRVFFCF